MTVQQSSVAGNDDVKDRIQGFLARWEADQRQVLPFFSRLLDRFSELNAVLDFIVRRGVSASLRAGVIANSASRPLFCLVDVVEDPEGRWLSVCFYADSVTDPDDLGNLVPNGLLDEDGYCFDIERPDKVLEDYVLARVLEAFEVARRKEG